MIRIRIGMRESSKLGRHGQLKSQSLSSTASRDHKGSKQIATLAHGLSLIILETEDKSDSENAKGSTGRSVRAKGRRCLCNHTMCQSRTSHSACVGKMRGRPCGSAAPASGASPTPARTRQRIGAVKRELVDRHNTSWQTKRSRGVQLKWREAQSRGRACLAVLVAREARQPEEEILHRQLVRVLVRALPPSLLHQPDARNSARACHAHRRR
eukprot:997204-Rhodomonas_salina.2